MLFERNIFRLDMKEERLGASIRGLGREFQVTDPMFEKARFLYLLNFMRGAVMNPESAESREREGFTLKTDTIDFLHTSSKIYVAFIDIKDTYGSIDHELMIKELREMVYPEQVLEITRDINIDSTATEPRNGELQTKTLQLKQDLELQEIKQLKEHKSEPELHGLKTERKTFPQVRKTLKFY